jgi:hypothetical protein
MEMNVYACDECGYSHFGCGGLSFAPDYGQQTVSCTQCQELQDVPLDDDFFFKYVETLHTTRVPERYRASKDLLATLTFTCKVEPWHTVHPWACTEDQSMGVPGTIIGVCPRCGGRMSPGNEEVIIE